MILELYIIDYLRDLKRTINPLDIMKPVSIKQYLFLLLLIIGYNTNAQDFTYVDSGTTFLLYDVSIPAGQNDIAYAAGAQFTANSDGIIIKSIDGGDTWSTIYPTSGTIDGIEKIEFIDELTGYAVGYDLFIKTADGGVTWTDLIVAADVWVYKSLTFHDANTGIVTALTNGGSYEVYTTNDGGLSWNPISSTANMPTFAVAYADATTLYAVGANEVISKSIDSGDTWTEIQSGTPTFYNLEVFFTDANNGIVSGEDGTIHTTLDGGATWNTYSNGYHNFYALTNDVYNGIWYAAGTDQDVFFSEDNGLNWILIHNGENVATFYDMEFFENGDGLICGSQGRMLKYYGFIIGYDDYEVNANLDLVYQPTSSLLDVVSSEVIGEITIYTLDGKQLLSHNSSATSVTLDTSSISNGLYMIKVKYGDTVRSLKFLKY